ncbi:ParB family chromosome partitioning protein [Litorivivens lipolytica]|uniref:ParB family chromosome partitioning protein n=1 Tax=Litorivivens lipolytica TaxID=1524264 RepID=A0A7W4W7U9_9GAMM|nr:ParB/RepB/Spo0J family partition protein [Litorivivens lipolytica]MBB3048885.1 ParB family chromosome partitioning protein [Litorivivens lipolytica]
MARKQRRISSLVAGAMEESESKPINTGGEPEVSRPPAEAKSRRRDQHVGISAATTDSPGDRSAAAYGALKAQVKELEGKADSISLTMPVTKLDVRLQLQKIPTELIDVSPENERDQELLDEAAVADILPSFQKNGQQQPGTVRPTKGGRFELIEGSRRLFCAKTCGVDYIALVGDIPDADVRVLSRTENVHKPPSAFERARSYQRDIDMGLFKTWEQLAAAEGLNKSTVSRYKALVEIDRQFVKAFPDPNSLSTTIAEWIRKVQNSDEVKRKALLDEAASLVQDKQQRVARGEDPLDGRAVLSRLRKAVRAAGAISQPTKKKPVVYRSKDGSVELKHSLSRDGLATKIEFKGVDAAVTQAVVERLIRELKLS